MKIIPCEGVKEELLFDMVEQVADKLDSLVELAPFDPFRDWYVFCKGEVRGMSRYQDMILRIGDLEPISILRNQFIHRAVTNQTLFNFLKSGKEFKKKVLASMKRSARRFDYYETQLPQWLGIANFLISLIPMAMSRPELCAYIEKALGQLERLLQELNTRYGITTSGSYMVLPDNFPYRDYIVRRYLMKGENIFYEHGPSTFLHFYNEKGGKDVNSWKDLPTYEIQSLLDRLKDTYHFCSKLMNDLEERENEDRSNSGYNG